MAKAFVNNLCEMLDAYFHNVTYGKQHQILQNRLLCPLNLISSTAHIFKLPSRKFPSFDKKTQESSFGEQFTYKIHSLIPLKSLNFKQHNDKSLDMQRNEL